LTLDFLVFLVLAGFIVWLSIHFREPVLGTEDELRAAADMGLHWELSGNKGFGFPDGPVEVMSRDDQFMYADDFNITGYSCEFMLRNCRGEYIFFVYRHDEAPYIKYTSQEVAKVRLGDKYVPMSG
jgi:hypothetical protein